MKELIVIGTCVCVSVAIFGVYVTQKDVAEKKESGGIRYSEFKELVRRTWITGMVAGEALILIILCLLNIKCQ